MEGGAGTCRPGGQAGCPASPGVPTQARSSLPLGLRGPKRGWCRSDGSSRGSKRGPGDGTEAQGLPAVPPAVRSIPSVPGDVPHADQQTHSISVLCTRGQDVSSAPWQNAHAHTDTYTDLVQVGPHTDSGLATAGHGEGLSRHPWGQSKHNPKAPTQETQRCQVPSSCRSLWGRAGTRPPLSLEPWQQPASTGAASASAEDTERRPRVPTSCVYLLVMTSLCLASFFWMDSRAFSHYLSNPWERESLRPPGETQDVFRNPSGHGCSHKAKPPGGRNLDSSFLREEATLHPLLPRAGRTLALGGQGGRRGGAGRGGARRAWKVLCAQSSVLTTDGKYTPRWAPHLSGGHDYIFDC